MLSKLLLLTQNSESLANQNDQIIGTNLQTPRWCSYVVKDLLQCQPTMFITIGDTQGHLYHIYFYIPPSCSAFLLQRESHFYSGMPLLRYGHMAGGESSLVSASRVVPTQLANNWLKPLLGDRILAFETWGQASGEDFQERCLHSPGFLIQYTPGGSGESACLTGSRMMLMLLLLVQGSHLDNHQSKSQLKFFLHFLL